MKQNSIKSLPSLNNEHLENIFNVYQDKDGFYYYNLLQSVTIPDNLPAGFYKTYFPVPGDTWPNISYKNYNTPNLWWIIIATNGIHNPVQNPTVGKKINILKSNYIPIILQQLTTQK